MIKEFARVFSLLLFFVVLFSSASFDFVQAQNIGTKISIMVENFKVTSRTDDCTLKVGEELDLMVATSQTAHSYNWEVSTDQGVSWSQLATTEEYKITNAQENTPANIPYEYRVTVASASGTTDSAIIYVLVSNDYGYRTISLRNGDTDVSAYLHNETRLVVRPLSETGWATDVFGDELADDCLPLMIYDISLVNQNDEVVPYFGTVTVEFDVGSQYNGMTLRVFHLHDDTVNVYSGQVIDGVLAVTVPGFSPFMVEIPADNTHTVTVNAEAGGSVTPYNNVNVAEGTDKTFTFLPNAGYVVDSVTLDGTPVTFTGNTYTLEDIRRDYTINVDFRQIIPSATLHTVTVNTPANGSISPHVDTQVQHGLPHTIHFYPNEGYELDTVRVNGVLVNVIGNSYTLSAVTGATEIIASFRTGDGQPPNIYKEISPSAGAGGSISPQENVRVEYGGEMYFYFIPDRGYEVDKVFIDGTETSVSGDFYRFINVNENHSINVTFKQSATPSPSSSPSPSQTSYIISASAGENGSVSPDGEIRIAKGISETFTFIPDADYEIDTVSVDGEKKDISGSSYTFTSVTANHRINVTFKKCATPQLPVTYYTITADSGKNGTISPSGDIQIVEGEKSCFSFFPDEGYNVDVLTVDGKTILPEKNFYCFGNIADDHAIHVTFKKATVAAETIYHTILLSVDGHGNISPSGEVRVPDGGSQTFHFIADDGHEVSEIYINGKKQDVVGGQFAIDNITADIELGVTFKPISFSYVSSTLVDLIGDWADENEPLWFWFLSIVVALPLLGALYFCLRKRPI